MESNEPITREIVGMLPSPEALEAAVSAFTSSGWDRSELSILAPHSLFGDEPLPADSRQVAKNPEAGHQAMISDNDVRQGRTLATGMAGVIAAFVASGATILTGGTALRSEEHTSELQSLMRHSYAVFCLNKNSP